MACGPGGGRCPGWDPEGSYYAHHLTPCPHRQLSLGLTPPCQAGGTLPLDARLSSVVLRGLIDLPSRE